MMDIITRIRGELSPHLATLAEIEQAADADAEQGMQQLARFIAALIRDGASSGDLRDIIARLDIIDTNQENIMTALQDLQAADQSLKTEVSTFLTDIAGRLGTVDDASAEAVVADIQAEVAALQGADTPATPPATPAPTA